MLDRQSEIIAHFIGQLDQATEKLTLRMQYDEIRAARASEPELNTLLHVEVNVSSEMGLTDFHPGVRLALPPYEMPPLGPPSVGVTAIMPLMPHLGASFLYDINLDLFGGLWRADTIHVTPLFELDPPGSFVTVAIQKNWLQDDDILLMRALDLSDAQMAARSDAAIDARFEALVGLAEQLDPLGTRLTDDGAFVTPAGIGEVLDTVARFDPDAAPAGTQATLHWSSSHADTASAAPVPEGGVLINGEAGETLPDTLALRLDARAQDDAAEDEPEAVADATTSAIVASRTGDETAPDAVHRIETGDNLLVNQAGVSISWVDAPTIAVAGAIHSFTLISQINVWSDEDGPGDGPHGTEAHNIAAVSHIANPYDPFAMPDSAEVPVTYAIAEIAGDLVVRSYTVQVNLVSDDDIVSFETTFHEVDIGLGANAASNLVLLQGFEAGFEMILVGGDMISLVSLQQLNLMNDDDLVVAGAGTAGDITTSGNLLWNEAQVDWTGLDSETAMSDGVADALASLTGGGAFDPFSLGGEDGLAGSEVGILLAVAGDFITEHHLVQINMLSDADTVQLHAAGLEHAGFARIDVATGDNVLANVAEVAVNGIDSAVMAGGGVYSDVVIYQAGMYGDAPDGFGCDGPPGGALASEAVAFLVDGMIGPGDDGEGHGGSVEYGPEGCGSGTHDALGTMVA
jgi:hypothetical protein